MHHAAHAKEDIFILVLMAMRDPSCSLCFNLESYKVYCKVQDPGYTKRGNCGLAQKDVYFYFDNWLSEFKTLMIN